MKILLAEDEKSGWDLFRRFAALQGHNITIVENGAEAWKTLELGVRFDVIITDNEMPEMSGVELLERVRDDPRFRHIPVALMSGRIDVSDEDHTYLQDIANERPDDTFWAKPVSIPDMLRTLSVLVEK